MRHYDQSAKIYNAQYCEEQKAKIEAAMDNLTLEKKGLVLDLGCGTGLLFARISEKTEFTIGTDISEGILKEAKKKTIQHKNVALILADADNTPFRSRVFDTVFAITLLQNTPNPVATLDEIKRVAKSHASIVVTGLRKAFNEQRFVKLLKQAKLNAAVLRLDRQKREYVAVCVREPLTLNSALKST